MGSLAWVDDFCNLRMHEHHVRVALQRGKIMPRKPFAIFRRNQQLPGFADQGVHDRRRQRRFRFEGFVRGDDELRKRMEPGEPGIVREQLQEMSRRRDLADGFLVADALGIYQCLVQVQQCAAQIHQMLPEIFRFR